MQGKRVVVTRAAEQSGQLVEELKRKGAVPVVVPMVGFGPPERPELLDEVIRKAKQYDWMFLTSQNALRALRQRCDVLELELRAAFSGVKIAAVGPATAEAATGAGLEVAYVATKHQGVVLAKELADEVRGKRVLLPRSDRANPELVEDLKRCDAEVAEVCAYKTIRPEQSELAAAKIAEAGNDAVLFFSPSAVHHLQELVGNKDFLELSQRSVFAAIGPVTEEALRKAGVERVLLARDTSVSAVVNTLADYFAQEGAGLSAGVKPL